MLLMGQGSITNSYPVEASGWDSNQSFFVETCKLEWDEETGKCLVLAHSLRPGAMIFLRLLQPGSPDRSLPVAYRVQLIGVTAEGQQRFRLKQLIAATNRDLRAEVLAGRFREDLFYRLSSIQIRIPSLTERLEDIPLLVQFFLKKYNAAYGKNIFGLTRRAQTLLLRHAWPGNVRELENVISSACITATGDFIDLGDLPEQLQHRETRSLERDDWEPLSLEEVRKVHIQRVLEMCRGNRLRAAQFLGIGRTSLYRYLKRDGLDTRKEKTGGAAA